MKFRVEEDYLGKRKIPHAALYGIQSDRARENFKISGMRLPPLFITTYAYIKKAAAQANTELMLLDPKRASAIIHACDEIIEGRHDKEFIVDIFQAGAGTSQNMNINEVISNRAIEILRGRKGDYSLIHPNDHVNMSQSSNDTFPTAMRVSIMLSQPALLTEIKKLVGSLRKDGRRFRKVLKSARTHLQDAVPVTLGMEFDAYAAALSSAAEKIERASKDLSKLPIGGTAVGTGLNTHRDYRRVVIKHLSKLTGLKLSSGRNLMELMQSTADFSLYSSALRNCAIELIKVSNDIRLLASGPNTGLAEIKLPPVQPGSSIMPGKMNPVICEALAMVCFQVVGNDGAVLLASQAGQLELNVMTPVIIHNILSSIEIMRNGIAMFRKRCVDEIHVNEERCRKYFERSFGLATVLNPRIGYAKASEIVQESLRKGESIIDVMRRKGYMKKDEIEAFLSPRDIMRPYVIRNLKDPKRRTRK